MTPQKLFPLHDRGMRSDFRSGSQHFVHKTITLSRARSSHPRQSAKCFAFTVIAIAAGAASLGFPSVLEANPNAPENAQRSTILFDLPALPLAIALERFMAITKVAVIVDSEVIGGRTSVALHGRFSPDQALRSLVAGTGLDPQPLEFEAYTIVASPRSTESQPLSRFTQYAAAIQQAVTNTLCQFDETRPTHYRVVVRMWLNWSGTTTCVELATRTGSPGLDRAISDALQRTEVGLPPPTDLPQPVKLAIMPRAIDTAVCAANDAGGGRVPDAGR